MAKKPESRLQRKIRDKLEREVGGWWFKVHGGPFQKEGIPDLMGCVESLFFALEVKRKGKKGVSDIQAETIDDIKKAGGCSFAITSAKEAVEVVRNHLMNHYFKEKSYEFKKQPGKVRLLRRSRRG